MSVPTPAYAGLEEALEDLIGADRPDQTPDRRAITALLETYFIDMVVALGPDISIEIGAHEATYSLNVKRRLPDATVIAYEAHPDIFEKYKGELSAAGVDYVHGLVGSTDATTTLRVPLKPDGSQKISMGSIYKDTRSREEITYQVPSLRLGSYHQDTDDKVVLWLDVEGGLDQVVAGAGPVLDRCLAVYAEVEDKPRWDGQMTEVAFTRKLGEHGLHPFLRDIQRRGWQYNLVYLREGAMSADDMARLESRYVEDAARAAKSARKGPD